MPPRPDIGSDMRNDFAVSGSEYVIFVCGEAESIEYGQIVVSELLRRRAGPLPIGWQPGGQAVPTCAAVHLPSGMIMPDGPIRPRGLSARRWGWGLQRAAYEGWLEPVCPAPEHVWGVQQLYAVSPAGAAVCQIHDPEYFTLVARVRAQATPAWVEALKAVHAPRDAMAGVRDEAVRMRTLSLFRRPNENDPLRAVDVPVFPPASLDLEVRTAALRRILAHAEEARAEVLALMDNYVLSLRDAAVRAEAPVEPVVQVAPHPTAPRPVR